jgi:hypothetical protein
MKPGEYIDAARVPLTLKPQAFGMWQITRVDSREIEWPNWQAQLQWKIQAGYDIVTFLKRMTLATPHSDGETVMEDSARELRKHLPIWLEAQGRILVTGLGLGCVVRGLLAKPEVEQVDVLEIDRSILRVVGHEFIGNRRVHLHLADAFDWQPGHKQFDYAWHDIWSEGESHISVLHARLMLRYSDFVKRQGAWGMPSWFKRLLSRSMPDKILV